ncbi:hypothetical protein BV20DRAFT_982125 [Pilatotrama ljubarskyi]|nr:hypothetical protein BV20DRAFT_982125 [Pilatotrama ljubarskyi]
MTGDQLPSLTAFNKRPRESSSDSDSQPHHRQRTRSPVETYNADSSPSPNSQFNVHDETSFARINAYLTNMIQTGYAGEARIATSAASSSPHSGRSIPRSGWHRTFRLPRSDAPPSESPYHDGPVMRRSRSGDLMPSSAVGVEDHAAPARPSCSAWMPADANPGFAAAATRALSTLGSDISMAESGSPAHTSNESEAPTNSCNNEDAMACPPYSGSLGSVPPQVQQTMSSSSAPHATSERIRGTDIDGELMLASLHRNADPLPRPLGGFPRVQMSDPTSLTKDIDPLQLRAWQELPPSTSAIIHVYGYNPREASPFVGTLLRAMIRKATSSFTAEIAAPIKSAELSFEAAKTHSLPASYLLYNVNSDAMKKLKAQACWSFDDLSFFVYDLTPTIPDFLFTLEGFLHCDACLVKGVVKAAIDRYREFTISLALANPELKGKTADEIAKFVMDSVRVSILQPSTDGPLFTNVYSKSPTKSPRLWTLWRDALASAEYRSSFVGVGRRSTVWKCSGCQGADHPRSHCPFAKIPGWTREVKGAAMTMSSDSRSGRGGSDTGTKLISG